MRQTIDRGNRQIHRMISEWQYISDELANRVRTADKATRAQKTRDLDDFVAEFMTKMPTLDDVRKDLDSRAKTNAQAPSGNTLSSSAAEGEKASTASNVLSDQPSDSE